MGQKIAKMVIFQVFDNLLELVINKNGLLAHSLSNIMLFLSKLNF